MVSNQTIHRQKMNKVIIWLARFGYSTRKMLCRMLDVNVTSSTRFFNTMAENGFIKLHSFSPSSHKIVMLTEEGYAIARFLLQHVKITERKRLSFPNIMHSYSIQSFLITNLNNADEYYTEMDLAQYPYYRRPDLLIQSGGKSVAVEVELNQKASSQVEYNFMQHIKDAEQNRFDNVLYLFSGVSVRDKYISLYEKECINVYNLHQGKLKKAGEYDMRDVHDRNLIQFSVFSFETL